MKNAPSIILILSLLFSFVASTAAFGIEVDFATGDPAVKFAASEHSRILKGVPGRIVLREDPAMEAQAWKLKTEGDTLAIVGRDGMGIAYGAFTFLEKYADVHWYASGLLEGPNAEHHNFRLRDGKGAGRLHICSPGSAFASGTFDAHDRKRTASHGYCYGSGEFWGTAIDRMIEKLVVPDGGGVTVNHPTWSRLDKGLLLELLDWDPRVLGIEVLEQGRCSENFWDWVLATGRQCFGFFVPDHGMHIKDFGVSVLVVQERTVEACLRAYRKGDFYGSAHGLGELKFTSIVFDGPTVKATTDKPAKFEVVTARGVRQTAEGTSVEWTCPKDDNNGEGPAVEIFARIRATALDGCGERLFTQASMLV